MRVKTIKATNFKSFKELAVSLGNLNILIGANASGKSNFIQVFKFLRDAVQHGLSDAISMQGGIEYLRNTAIGASESMTLEVTYELERQPLMSLRGGKQPLGVRFTHVEYSFALAGGKRSRAFEVTRDHLRQTCEFVELRRRKNHAAEPVSLGTGQLVLSRVGNKEHAEAQIPEGIPVKAEHLIPPIPFELPPPSDRLLLEPVPYLWFASPYESFGGIAVYDFDPKLPKKAIPITGKTALEEDASNLALVLKAIIEDKSQKRRFSNLIKDLLPFVDDVGVERFADKSLLFTLREIYGRHLYLPASLISDGTINIAALIIAVYFQQRPLIIIEEPERNVHPFLISRIVSHLKDASERRQIIVSTHNPEFVRHADLDSILLVSRDGQGFSSVARPAERQDVRTFMRHDIGADDLYVQSLLGV